MRHEFDITLQDMQDSLDETFARGRGANKFEIDIGHYQDTSHAPHFKSGTEAVNLVFDVLCELGFEVMAYRYENGQIWAGLRVSET